MKILELFAGSCSFTKTAWKLNKAKVENGFWDAEFYNTFTTDIKQNPDNTVDYVVDLMDFDYSKLPFDPDFVWASPPCTTYSIASCSTHWTPPPDRQPKTEKARDNELLIGKTLEILQELQPKYYIIENPRGLLRKMDTLEHLNRTTVTYCQYGDERMKPTDLWHNLDWKAREMCKNGMPCHQSAPRGSRTGTQGLKGNYERSKVPSELCKEILTSVA